MCWACEQLRALRPTQAPEVKINRWDLLFTGSLVNSNNLYEVARFFSPSAPRHSPGSPWARGAVWGWPHTCKEEGDDDLDEDGDKEENEDECEKKDKEKDMDMDEKRGQGLGPGREQGQENMGEDENKDKDKNMDEDEHKDK